jgi:hypothetical protein
VPEDVNTLDWATSDPRVVTNLLDGHNGTTSDRHSWLAPFVPHIPTVVTLAYDQPITLGAIRLWNYRKTRSRGVKQLQVLLDGWWNSLSPDLSSLLCVLCVFSTSTSTSTFALASTSTSASTLALTSAPPSPLPSFTAVFARALA